MQTKVCLVVYLYEKVKYTDTSKDITHIIGRDTGLMIRAFSAALSDDNLLVQRGALDLLLQSLRVESHAVTQASPEDRTILMRAATGVVLRRDLSLNRRLFSWLLGPDEHSEKQIEYLRKNALDLLSATLRVSQMSSPHGWERLTMARMRCSIHLQSTRWPAPSVSTSHYWTSGRLVHSLQRK